MKTPQKVWSFHQRVALVMAVILVAETVYPSAALALTSGPSAPEFSSFEPVATTNMVNEFSGDFTYNLPVLNIPGGSGGGYALSLSYHSGESLESEASWVGYGWTLNPGAISRSKRGFADDTKGKHTYYNDVPANWTIEGGLSVGNLEFYSANLALSYSGAMRYNNYKGFGLSGSARLAWDGVGSLGFSVDDGKKSYSGKINPGLLLSVFKVKHKEETKKNADKEGEQQKKAKFERLKRFKDKNADKISTAKGYLTSIGKAYGLYTLDEINAPMAVTPYIGTSFNYTGGIEADIAPISVGINVGMEGRFSSQKNIPFRDLNGYGYMYLDEAANGNHDQDMMDYSVEKESTYNKRDRYLSIPFSTADFYNVSGEGLSGGFRMHRKKPGHFRPNRVLSATAIGSTAVDVHLGTNYGVGFDVGTGVQTLGVSGNGWGNFISSDLPGNTWDYQFSADDDEPFFFRYSGDLGGDVDFDPTNSLSAASISVVNPVIGVKMCEPVLPPSAQKQLTSYVDGVNRSGRSGYIDYHTNAQLRQAAPTGKLIYAEENNANTSDVPIDRSALPQEGIGEMVSYNEEGNRYVYGLPVYARDEVSLQYDLNGAAPGDIKNNFLARKNLNAGYKSKVGEKDEAPYATSYLLTQITTPDYVDRTMNGPTPDDFGGYTRFEYTKVHGTFPQGDNWYKWRMPYLGLYYSPGSQSDLTDDMGSYRSGEKEVYYLSRIVTKTHIAEFTLDNRKDAQGAANDDEAINTLTGGVTPHGVSKRLKEINLYVNDGLDQTGKKIKTIHFEYDDVNGLCMGLPNAATSSTPKLTLKKVWFEYDGIVPVKISPYVFNYEYPSSANQAHPTTYPAPYTSLLNPGNYSSGEQNPKYDPLLVDPWGNYRKDLYLQTGGDGIHPESRYSLQQSHIDQTPDTQFDPAAWQLKSIILPSGGEIHVQYEQDRYLYVQDRRALSMVSLKTESSGTSNRYYLNVEEDFGITTPQEKLALMNQINYRYHGKKIYFKFLYALVGNNPDLRKCNSDYVNGYADFKIAGIDLSGNLYVEFDNSGNYSLPYDVCSEYMRTEKQGKLDPNGNCDPATQGISENGTVSSMLNQLLTRFTSVFTPNNICAKINPRLSYLRIPVLKEKLGGGLRVKRLMMYDYKTADGQPELYGSEFIYENDNGECSGVATNEPSSIREENALIDFVEKRKDGKFEMPKIIAGKQTEQFEGPLGESILPAPSVGYSRIVVKNIHNGKSNTGFAVSDYYTARDFPFDGYYTDLGVNGVTYTEINSVTQEKDWLMVPAGMVNLSITNFWTTQGYRFITNQMHGQPKGIATYVGDYSNGKLALIAKTSSTEYEYFRPGEKIPMVDRTTGQVSYRTPGKEMEVMYETRSVEDIAMNTALEMDIAIGVATPVFLVNFSMAPKVDYSERRMRTHISNKTIDFPAIQKSVITMEDGIVHRTDNIAFDYYTGKPVRTTTTDGYDKLNLQQSSNHNGTYTLYNVPAVWEYKGMGQKAINQGAVLTVGDVAGLSVSLGTVGGGYGLAFNNSGSTGSTGCLFAGNLVAGDLIKVSYVGSGNVAYFHVDGPVGGNLRVLPSANLNSSLPSMGPVSRIEVVKSGRSNQLTDLAGSYTTYGIDQSQQFSGSSYWASLAFIDKMNYVLNDLSKLGTSPAFGPPGPGASIDAGAGCTGNVEIRLMRDDLDNLRITVTVPSGTGCSNRLIGPYWPGGKFTVDLSNGTIYYEAPNTCSKIPVPCIRLCIQDGKYVVKNVVASAAQTYDNTWPYNGSYYPSVSSPSSLSFNSYETAEKGKWRPLGTYVYKSTTVPGVGTATARNYNNAGTYDMTLFNWQDPAQNDASTWIKTTTATRYSPHGDLLEEQDALGIYSTAKVGYNGVLTTLTANNAVYETAQFESFEKVYGFGASRFLEEGIPVNIINVDITKAHSGRASFVIGAGNVFTFNPFKLSASLQSKGMSVKAWVKDADYSLYPLMARLTNGTAPAIDVPMQKVAQTGEWTLFEAKCTNFTGFALNDNITVSLVKNSTATTVSVDDVRLQPLESTMTAYVYDISSLRLLTSFDDQHFGLYYQYNAEGKLVRKLVETERGLKTVEEKQYNTPKVAR